MSNTSHVRSLLLVGASAATLGLAIATPAFAQPARPAAPANATEVTEVTVTAERRAVNLQDVPVAVSAFTSAQRDVQGIQTIQDITNFTPGLTYSTTLDRTSLRGLGRLTNVLSADAAVAVYSDDFFTTSTFEAGRDTLFINRVEVLRGPQGTLYGRNAIGGAINIISNRPTHDFYAEGRVTISNYNAQTYSAVISGPVTDFLRLRLSGYDIQQTGGYFHNFAGPDEGGIHHEWYVEGQVEMDLGEHSQLWVKAFTLRFDNNRSGPGALLFTPITGHYDTALLPPSSIDFNSGYGYNPAAINPVGRAGLTDNPALTDIRSVSHNTPLDIDLRDTWAIDVHWTTHFPGVDFRYVGGYDVYDYNLNGEWDQLSITSYQIPLNPAGPCATGAFGPCTNLTVYPEQVFNYREFNRWYSHEFLLSSTWDKPVQFIAGFFYFDEHYQQPTLIYTDPRQTQLDNPILSFNNAPNLHHDLYNAEYRMETRSTAIFGQVDWDVTPQWRLTGGLRYTRDHKAGDEFYRLVVYTDALGDPANLGVFTPSLDATQFTASFDPWPGVVTPAHFLPDGRLMRSLSANFSAVTGTAAIQWRPNDDNLIYLRYSRGYKAGGFNAGAVSASPETQPEHVDAYELGWNWTYGHTFQMQTAAYYYNYQDAQLPNGVNTGGVILTQFFNIPRARSDGFELSALWRPIEPLDISVTYSFNDTSILSGCTLVGVVPTGTCLVDASDPSAIQPGAHPVEPFNPLNPTATRAQSIQGNALAQAPRNKFSINANYTFHFNPGDLILSASYIWKDEAFSDLFQRSYNRSPPWDQIDLRATWRSSDHRYEIIGFVRNLTDSLGYEAAGGGVLHSNNVVVNTYTLTPPRTYGVEFHYRFGHP
jgi:iron complex outermembrane receptor protein